MVVIVTSKALGLKGVIHISYNYFEHQAKSHVSILRFAFSHFDLLVLRYLQCWKRNRLICLSSSIKVHFRPHRTPLMSSQNAMHNPTVLSAGVVLVFVLSVRSNACVGLISAPSPESSNLSYSPHRPFSQPIFSHHQEVLHLVVHPADHSCPAAEEGIGNSEADRQEVGTGS